MSDFPVLFKADLIFKDFSRKLKYFSSLCEPCITDKETLFFSSAIKLLVLVDSSMESHTVQSLYKTVWGCWLVGFVALRPKSTAMVIAGRSVHLTTLFPGQA